MKKIFTSLFMVLMLVQASCVSYHVLQESKEDIATRRAILSDNEAALHAIQMGENPAPYGVKVTNVEAVRERPLLQFGAAVVDGLLVFGGIEGVRWVRKEIRSDNGEVTTVKAEGGRDGNTIIIDGDGNTVVVRGDQQTYGSEMPAIPLAP